VSSVLRFPDCIVLDAGFRAYGSQVKSNITFSELAYTVVGAH
jgi:hypothetical protein